LVAGISVVQAEPGAHAPFEAKGRVIKNHDGDTITLATNDHGVLTIRLSEADAPETGQGYWKVARDAESALNSMGVREIARSQ